MSYALFAYGTLQFDDVFATVMGQSRPSSAAVLRDHRRERFIGDIFPGLVPSPGDSVDGVVYHDIDRAMLARLDDFEGELYVRRLLTVEWDASHGMAFTYLVAGRYRGRFAGEWDPHWFARWQKAAFLARIKTGAGR
jgi:gamma-glutamylcyclotransferase (GGCT)/AIG2-like uncharacterized protein YtfP